MILTDAEILACMQAGTIKIEPFDPTCLGSNSYDVHLGRMLGEYVERELDAKKHNRKRALAENPRMSPTGSAVSAALKLPLSAAVPTMATPSTLIASSSTLAISVVVALTKRVVPPNGSVVVTTNRMNAPTWLWSEAMA